MTEPPVWGTPEPGPEVSATAAPRWGEHAVAGPPTPETVGGFFLVVEQITDNAIWRVQPGPVWAGADRGIAREAALELARNYRPEHPFNQKGRLVLRIDPDNLLVVVRGATQTYHFRVTVAERVA